MRRYFIPLLFAFAFLVQANSCKKSKPPTTTPVYNSEFPTNPGTFWKYKRYDSVANILDTITISVVGTTTLNTGEPVAVWKITSLYNPTDTNYVSNKSDGIRIYQNKSATSPFKRYVFPLTVGEKWITYNVFDTNKVTQQGPVTVLAGSFSNAFRINRDVVLLPGYNPIKEDEWFVPNVGMVSRYYFDAGAGFMNKYKYELVTYSIN